MISDGAVDRAEKQVAEAKTPGVADALLADSQKADKPKADQQNNGITKDEVEKAEKQIAEDKKPLCALRFFEPAFTVPGPGGGTWGPWISERVYKNGNFEAMRAVGPGQHDTSFHVKIGNKQYFDVVGADGKDSVMLVSGVKMGDPLPHIKEGSKTYKEVVHAIHTIDFDHIPEYNFQGGKRKVTDGHKTQDRHR